MLLILVVLVRIGQRRLAERRVRTDDFHSEDIKKIKVRLTSQNGDKPTKSINKSIM